MISKWKCPTGSGNWVTLKEASCLLRERLVKLLLNDKNGQRPCFGKTELFDDPHWHDLLFFNEYFDGDDGHGVGGIIRPAGPD